MSGAEPNQIGVCKFISQDWRTWHFQSRRSPNVFHTVDLAEFDCSGACSCEHFDFKIRPLIRGGLIRPHSDAAKCKHIRRAEKILCYRIKKKLFASTNPNPIPK